MWDDRNQWGLVWSGDEGSEDEGSDWSPSPPWRVIAACDWASFTHRLLLRKLLRDKHDVLFHSPSRSSSYGRLLICGRLLRGLANGQHPLSRIDRLEFYYNGRGPPY